MVWCFCFIFFSLHLFCWCLHWLQNQKMQRIWLSAIFFKPEFHIMTFKFTKTFFLFCFDRNIFAKQISSSLKVSNINCNLWGVDIRDRKSCRAKWYVGTCIYNSMVRAQTRTDLGMCTYQTDLWTDLDTYIASNACNMKLRTNIDKIRTTITW